MSDERCKFAGHAQPRVLVDRHGDGCPGDECAGCEPCTRSHCRVCATVHSAGVCGGCMTAMRDDLADIRRMTESLPEEVEHRGINGDAMALLGPVADPEAWGHHQASAAVGRTAEQWTDGNDYLHPLWTLGVWAGVYREAFDHMEASTATIDGEADYLDRQLGTIAAYEHVPVEDFSRDLRKCRGRLEDVLRDGERAEQGRLCPDCEDGDKRRLVKHYDQRDKTGASDEWRCPVEREHRWTEASYRRAVADDYLAYADALTASQMAQQYDVKPGSLRGWASKGHVRIRGKNHLGLTTYDVADTKRMLLEDQPRSA